ncbi:hypothetical protein Zmor_015629 [Zophobas morio]|uniref:Uncharacterized protein n=1 Tax=Zophobas morio TaxID=2755281 RepID=A0AA38MHU6_9CUCU|nr:hypothetical protein Zmor_015629 [Zophobas morio]
MSEFFPTILSCRSEHDLTDEEIKRDEASGNYYKNPKYKQHFLCILQKEGLIKESGELDTEVIKSKFEVAGVTDAEWTEIFKCSADKPTPEDTAFEFIECIYKHAKIVSDDD